MREYPGAERGRPSKAVRDKIRRHEVALARARAVMGPAKLIRGKRKRVDKINALAYPKGVLRPRSLKVAFVPSPDPQSVKRVTVRGKNLIVQRERFGRRVREIRRPLTETQAARAVSDLEGFSQRFDPGERRGVMFRIETASGHSVGSGAATRFPLEMDFETLQEVLDDLASSYGDFAIWFGGVTVIA